MQALQPSQSNIIKNTKSKVEEHFVEIEQHLESSFARIYELIDSIILKSFGGMNHENDSLLELPQFIQFPIDLFDYSQILESVKPLINKVIKNEIQIKDIKITEASCQQKIINETIQQNNIKKQENDSQIGEIKESDSILTENFQEMIQVENKQKQLEQQLMMYKQVQFNLIDDSNQQIGICFAIVFNKDGSIMISCDSNEIKIWNFQQGTFKLSNSYNKHSQAVSCLVYSKKTNNFISGCYNNQIICWQQINQNEWKCSQPFEQHDIVHCLLLNKQEDQLISGGDDRKIIVWKVDFINNDLTFLYSLDQHTNSVKSLSFNQSETVLASCGYSHFIIWEKGLQGNGNLNINRMFHYTEIKSIS